MSAGGMKNEVADFYVPYFHAKVNTIPNCNEKLQP
jgi:hypothetical protein